MSKSHVDHGTIEQFAVDRVNLPQDKSNEYRAQVRRLREKIEAYVADHPDFSIKKMLLSGSLAKCTALRSLNDIDVACYISGADAPKEIDELLQFLAEKLRSAFPNFKPEQVVPQTYSVTVSFRGTGLDVDIVPILYDGDPDWYGDLVSQDDRTFLRTCIPRHLEFAKKRRMAQDGDFAQVARLLKFWAGRLKAETEDFRFKSFMVELILAHVADGGADMKDYPEAMQAFFTYIARSGLKETILFTDYYSASDAPQFGDVIRILDPVNASNNVARLYSEAHRSAIVEAALDAGDAIDSANAAPTKGATVAYWQKVLGPSFSA